MEIVGVFGKMAKWKGFESRNLARRERRHWTSNRPSHLSLSLFLSRCRSIPLPLPRASIGRSIDRSQVGLFVRMFAWVGARSFVSSVSLSRSELSFLGKAIFCQLQPPPRLY